MTLLCDQGSSKTGENSLKQGKLFLDRDIGRILVVFGAKRLRILIFFAYFHDLIIIHINTSKFNHHV